MRRVPLLVALLALCAAHGPLAQQLDVLAYESGMAARLDGQGSIRYLSGGVGEESREALHLAGLGFPLKVVMATRAEGAYVGLVDVLVRKAGAAPVAVIQDVGPWLYLDLPAGRYTIEAERRNGQKVTSPAVEVRKGSTKQLLISF